MADYEENISPGLLPQGNFSAYNTLVDANNEILFKQAGQIIYIISTDTFYYWDGAAWIAFGGGSSSSTITANRQIASYGLVLSDASKLVEMNVAGANNLTVPLNATQAFAIGTQIMISQYGAGQTTIVATGGVTIRSSGGKLKLSGQYSGASLLKIGTDEWYLFGDITT